MEKTCAKLYLIQAKRRLFVQLIFRLLRHSRNPLYSLIVLLLEKNPTGRFALDFTNVRNLLTGSTFIRLVGFSTFVTLISWFLLPIKTNKSGLPLSLGLLQMGHSTFFSFVWNLDRKILDSSFFFIRSG